MRRALALVLLAAAVAAGSWYAVTAAPLPFVKMWWDEFDYGDPLHKRHRMADGFVFSRALIGKTADDIVEKLGLPPETPYFPDWNLVYPLGRERGRHWANTEWLVVRLDASESAIEARIVRD